MRIILKNIGIIVFAVLLHLFFYGSEHIQKLDYKFYDWTTMLEHKIYNDEDTFYTVIVDIDEKSLIELGQWPWPRVIDANLIERINEMKPSAIGVNILFPEEDRVSPIYIQEFYRRFFDLDVKFQGFSEILKDNDKRLRMALDASNSIIPISFSNNKYMKKHCEDLSYKNNLFKDFKTHFVASSLICNHEKIQQGMENFGFINAWSDSDEILRRVPIFVRFKKEVYPSFALATLLSFDKNREFNSDQDTLLVKFSEHKPKVFSAMDILTGKVPSCEIRGKVVLLGSSVIGLDSQYTISNGQKISNNMIHAFAIENMIANSFLTQPQHYKKISIILSFLLSLLIIFLLSEKRYFLIVGVVLSVMLLSFSWLFSSYLNGVYVSIGYLWMPFFYFFITVLMYYLKMIHHEKQQQENLLIRQSKLASMGEMITLIAHQWRQPLSVINGIVLNIDIDHRMEKLHAQKLEEHLIQIEDTTAYLSKTINDFADFFSTNKNKETFYISDVIHQAEQLTGIASQGNVDIVYRTGEEIKIVGYKSELIQSILVVLNNAIQACQKNLSEIGQGKIMIDTKIIEDQLLISIEDNGGGIEPKDLAKIFDPYFTTKKQGTGLGLYILKLIIEDSMNGRVALRNGREGAIFTMIIPMGN